MGKSLDSFHNISISTPLLSSSHPFITVIMAAEQDRDVPEDAITVHTVLTLKREGDFPKIKEHLRRLEEETKKFVSEFNSPPPLHIFCICN